MRVPEIANSDLCAECEVARCDFRGKSQASLKVIFGCVDTLNNTNHQAEEILAGEVLPKPLIPPTDLAEAAFIVAARQELIHMASLAAVRAGIQRTE